MEICIDFDGTCVTHSYPVVGKNIGAQAVLEKLIQNGHKLILFTMRGGEPLLDAIDWFHKNQIPLYGVNKNPRQEEWTSSPKAYGQLYIDDAALACPIKRDPTLSKRPFVDWEEVEKWLINNNIIN
jgi:hypothetical protein